MRETFPEPYVVPGNIAGSPYRCGLAFKRRTILYWAGTTIASSVFAWRPLEISLWQSALSIAVALVLLTLVRRLVPVRPVEVILSAALCLVVQPIIGTLIGSLCESNVDLRMVYLVPAGLVVYTVLAGHDFSHFGYAVLGSVLALSVGVGLAGFHVLDATEAAFATVVTMAATVFIASDLSMLMRRRLPGEELGAAADLYRDTINFVTYTFRVVHYVRRYRFH